MGRWSLVVALVVCGACGGRTELGDGGAAALPGCVEASRCGGELFGRWRAVATCADLGFVSAVLPCDGLVIREQSPSIAGFKSYSKEGSYSSRLSYAGWVRLFVPESCSDVSSTPARCSLLEGSLERRGELLLEDVVCDISDGGCVCDATLLPFERERSGTFTVRDGHLVEELGDEGDYCVDGDTLRLNQSAGDQLVFSRER